VVRQYIMEENVAKQSLWQLGSKEGMVSQYTLQRHVPNHLTFPLLCLPPKGFTISQACHRLAAKSTAYGPSGSFDKQMITKGDVRESHLSIPYKTPSCNQ
jgi:hypothetical protein